MSQISRFPQEQDPTGRDPHTPGAKLDSGKPPIVQGVIQYFPRALNAVAVVSKKGADKYCWKGWENVPDGITRYRDAMGRHILEESIEGPHDIKGGTQVLHAAQAAWNALAVLELMLREGIPLEVPTQGA
jgi:hypothetical protein